MQSVAGGTVDQELKHRNSLSIRDMQAVMMNILSRKRFVYTMSDIFKFIFTCLCLRKTMKKSHHHLYRKGERKLMEELDVISLLRSMRQIKLLTQVMLNQKQQLLLRFQRRNIIESSTSSGSDNREKNDISKLIESKNSLIRLSSV